MRQKMDEADIRKKTETKALADFLRWEMPTGQASKYSPPSPKTTRRSTQTNVTSASVTTSSLPLIPSTSIKEFEYEPPKQERVDDDDDYDEDDNFVEDEARTHGRENVSSVASPYLMPYVYKRRSLDTQYGVCKDGDMFMIGDSPLVVGTGTDIMIKEGVIKGSKGLWELLTRKKMNTEFITKNDLKT